VLKPVKKILELMHIPDIPLGAPPLILMPLHKGRHAHIAETIQRFYWPAFKEIMRCGWSMKA
jgi:hypothetical protein